MNKNTASEAWDELLLGSGRSMRLFIFLSLSKGASLSSWERHTLPFSLCFTAGEEPRFFRLSGSSYAHKSTYSCGENEIGGTQDFGPGIGEVRGGGKRSACSWLGGSECLPCSLVKSTSPSRAQQLVELTVLLALVLV